MLQSLQTTHKPVVPVQVPWGMVTGPDGNLYIAMDDEFEVAQHIPFNQELPPLRGCLFMPAPVTASLGLSENSPGLT